MIIIGITAPIGCGKSYVAEVFAKKGIPSLDTDKIYHSLISSPTETVEALRREYGDCVVNTDGSIDRVALGSIVFNDKEKLRRLNEITHPRVLAELERLLSEYENKGTSAVTVQVPLMFESGFDKRCDTVICVVADEQIRTARICKRDGCTAEKAKKRINNQKDINFYIANSSERVYNNGTEDLSEQVDLILGKLGLGVQI